MEIFEQMIDYEVERVVQCYNNSEQTKIETVQFLNEFDEFYLWKK